MVAKPYLAFMMNIIEQDVDLWEVWIEYDQFHPDFFGTLYVHGEIASGTKSILPLAKLKNGLSGQLILQLPERSTRNNYTSEVFFSEPIRNLNQYSSVSIYAGNELIGCFHDIEIMI